MSKFDKVLVAVLAGVVALAGAAGLLYSHLAAEDAPIPIVGSLTPTLSDLEPAPEDPPSGDYDPPSDHTPAPAYDDPPSREYDPPYDYTPAPYYDPPPDYSASGGDLDCDDFGTNDFAVGSDDPHGIDRDGDGVACES